MPIFSEIHTGPRNPGDPVQTFANELVRLDGELFGDPDFCTLRVRGGIYFDLPSPGECELTELPSGDFAVDSFFDITYQIEFEGCPDGAARRLGGHHNRDGRLAARRAQPAELRAVRRRLGLPAGAVRGPGPGMHATLRQLQPGDRAEPRGGLRVPVSG